MNDEELVNWTSERVRAARVRLRSMSREELLAEAEEVVGQVVLLAGDVGATGWPPGLPLARVLDRHVAPAALRSRPR